MTHNKMLETQITQLANTLKDCASTSSLPSQEVDPKKPVYSITTRSRRVLEERVSWDCEEDKKKSVSSEKKEADLSRDVRKEESHKKKKSDERKQEEVRKPDLPYPQKLMRNKLDEKFRRFIEIMKEVHLLIPLTEAMTQMPRYSKFLKDILSVKRDCNEIDSVELGECYSALIHNDLPKKMKDPGNFSIPCKIKSKMFENALCDLSASVSIMPFSVFKKLKLGELLPTNMTLQLANRSIKFPKGRVEDVPLKIVGFTKPVDFIVLKIEENDHIPIILGRPFLATSGALVDVKGGQITLRVGNKKGSFELKPMHVPLSLMKGIKCDDSLSSFDNVYVIDSSSNNVHDIFDDVLVSFDCMKVSEDKKELPKAMNEEEIDFPNWFELYPREEEEDSMEVDGVKPSTKINKIKKKARASRKKRMRLKMRNEKIIFDVQASEVLSSNNERLLKNEGEVVLSATFDKVVFFDPS
ncbi:uncharacterized protein LOC110691621 [Chenopodium quinoa]|uniref:uncharacterized protein LOC110691621 n=1 Tax=Chenopodium quinoa TaxID=63459 RepID=UPI000B780766|nr:uncharacterized protein LOC110691621 [Chenopodium quinoa]